MTAPDPADPAPKPAPPAEPTIRVARPPGPGPAKRAEVAADGGSSPGVPPDNDPTVGLPDQAPVARQPTLTFGKPAPVKVTVSARPRRRYRTWPWIAAVVLALVVLGVVLLVMLLRGATIDGGTDLIGSSRPMGSESTTAIDDRPPAEQH